MSLADALAGKVPAVGVNGTKRVHRMGHDDDVIEQSTEDQPREESTMPKTTLQARYRGTGEERVLERNGIYRNDRQVREKHVFHKIDRDNPRTEIEVEEISPGLFEALAPPVVVERPKRKALRDPSPITMERGAVIPYEPF